MIVKKFEDIPLEFGYKICHQINDCKYLSGKYAQFYVVEVMKSNDCVSHYENKIYESVD